MTILKTEDMASVRGVARAVLEEGVTVGNKICVSGLSAREGGGRWSESRGPEVGRRIGCATGRVRQRDTALGGVVSIATLSL